MTFIDTARLADKQAAYHAALPDMGPLPDAALRLSDMDDDIAACGAAMAQELRVEPGLDAKGCGAYLVNRLGCDIGRAVAALDMSGQDLSPLDPTTTGAASTLVAGEEDGETCYYLATVVTVASCRQGGSPEPDAAAKTIEALFAPVVAGVAVACTLSAGALWRLVTDGVAAAYLNLGTAAGETRRAVARAEAILKWRGTRLFAKQLNFLELTLPAAENPLGEDITRTFRERSGCCRYYTAPRSGGAYCGTCIHRKNRPDRFRRAMLHRARLAAGQPGIL